MEGCTAVGSTSVGSMAVAVMAIHITTIKLVACSADRCRLNWEACCRRVAVEEGSTAVVGNTAVAGMAIHITTIVLGARRADRRRACMFKEGAGVSREACTARCLNREACWGMVVAGSTVAADMDIPITTIKLGARRADRHPACIIKEEGIITEGGSMLAGIKVEG